VAEVFTGSKGVLVSLEDTIKGFKGLCAGDYDDLPEQAFYMVGSIDEAIEKAKTLKGKESSAPKEEKKEDKKEEGKAA